MVERTGARMQASRREGVRRLRLFVPDALAAGRAIMLDGARAHYLCNVMRARPGQSILLFNGSDGEWRAAITSLAARSAGLLLQTQTRPQRRETVLALLFAPLKPTPLTFLIQKATELGVSHLLPTDTRHAGRMRLNDNRLRTIAMEAAEQCGRLTLPVLAPSMPLADRLADWPSQRPLWLGDETGNGVPLAAALAAERAGAAGCLIGPEGGFHAEELDLIRKLPIVRPVCLGPRILRAETAGLAMLAVIQAMRGDRTRGNGVECQDQAQPI